MAQRGRLIDPIEDVGSEIAKNAEDGSLNIENISISQLLPITAAEARIVQPFDGYPAKRITIGAVTTFRHHIVILKPIIQIPQDSANRKVKVKGGKLEQVMTYHNRFVRDLESKDNITIMFDREMKLKDATVFFAIVESNNVRAQICFKYDTKRERIMPDDRYVLLDRDQVSRLRRVFEQVINPNIKMEQQARFISGESQADTGEIEPVPAD
jgi:hypothetical protein